MITNILQSERFDVLLKGKVSLNKTLHPLALSLSDAPPRAVTHPQLPIFLCLSNRKSAFPLHLLLSSLFHEYWGVSGGCPGAGHPVRGLLTVPRLSAGAYWREIHINTCLLCLQPLDTAMLPAWHSQALHGPPVETRRRWGFNASMALECGPPVSPPVALTDLSRQCTVWKGTLPSPVAVSNSISCLFGSHLACRDYFL